MAEYSVLQVLLPLDNFLRLIYKEIKEGTKERKKGVMDEHKKEIIHR
jgi:hypothetical protein